MLFKTEEPIDDNLLMLIKRIKRLIKKNPDIKWIKDRSQWIVLFDGWVSGTVNILYSWIDKYKYIVTINSENGESINIGSFLTIDDVIMSLKFLSFMDKGCSKQIIEFLAENVKSYSLQESINRLATNSEINVTAEERIILNIDEKHRGRLKSRNYGL